MTETKTKITAPRDRAAITEIADAARRLRDAASVRMLSLDEVRDLSEIIERLTAETVFWFDAYCALAKRGRDGGIKAKFADHTDVQLAERFINDFYSTAPRYRTARTMKTMVIDLVNGLREPEGVS